MESENTQTEKKLGWLTQTENGDYIVSTKVGDIVLREQNAETLDSALSLSEKTGKDPSTILLMKSIVDKEKFPDREILKLPGSVYVKLKKAIVEIYDLSDFL